MKTLKQKPIEKERANDYLLTVLGDYVQEDDLFDGNKFLVRYEYEDGEDRVFTVEITKQEGDFWISTKKYGIFDIVLIDKNKKVTEEDVHSLIESWTKRYKYSFQKNLMDFLGSDSEEAKFLQYTDIEDALSQTLLVGFALISKRLEKIIQKA